MVSVVRMRCLSAEETWPGTEAGALCSPGSVGGEAGPGETPGG